MGNRHSSKNNVNRKVENVWLDWLGIEPRTAAEEIIHGQNLFGSLEYEKKLLVTYVDLPLQYFIKNIPYFIA